MRRHTVIASAAGAVLLMWANDNWHATHAACGAQAATNDCAAQYAPVRQDAAAAAAMRKQLQLKATRDSDVARQIAALIPRPSAELYRWLDVLAATIEIARAEHVDQPAEGSLIDGAIRGLKRLRDDMLAIERFEQELAGLASVNEHRQGHTADRGLAILGRAIAAARAGSFDATRDKQIVEAAIHGMLAALDPHAAYITPAQWRRMQNHSRG
jgi:hypothetical protein